MANMNFEDALELALQTTKQYIDTGINKLEDDLNNNLECLTEEDIDTIINNINGI